MFLPSNFYFICQNNACQNNVHLQLHFTWLATIKNKLQFATADMHVTECCVFNNKQMPVVSGFVKSTNKSKILAITIGPFFMTYQNLPGRCLVYKHGSHVINIPKADWSSMKNKQITAMLLVGYEKQALCDKNELTVAVNCSDTGTSCSSHVRC